MKRTVKYQIISVIGGFTFLFLIVMIASTKAIYAVPLILLAVVLIAEGCVITRLILEGIEWIVNKKRIKQI